MVDYPPQIVDLLPYNKAIFSPIYLRNKSPFIQQLRHYSLQNYLKTVNKLFQIWKNEFLNIL